MRTPAKRSDYGYVPVKPPRDLSGLRVMVCESEVQAYAARHPALSPMQVRSIMLAYGPLRKDVEDALLAASRSMPPHD